MKRGMLMLALMSLLLVGGCNHLAYVCYVFFPGTGERTVQAEYSGLEGKSVAVVVYADENVQYAYNSVQIDMTAMVSAHLKENVKGLTAIESRKVVAYQRANLAWDEKDLVEIGKDLDADFVLFVSLVEFSTVEEGYLDLIRAKITAEVSLYETSKPSRQSRAWKGEDIHVSFPQTPAARVADNERKYRLICMQMFTRELGKKFYKHKESIEK